jgi:hypothetical protein
VRQSTTLILLFAYCSSWTQIPQWEAFYGGDPYLTYNVNKMVTDKSGNTYVYGYTMDSLYNLTGVIIKYDTWGTQKWVNTYAGLGPYGKIKLDDIGNVYVISRIDGLSFAYDYLTLKYDNDGNFKWSAVYNGSGNLMDMPHDITIDDSLNVYVTGTAIAIATGNDVATIKYDSLGNQKWVAIYNYSDNPGDGGGAVIVDDSHNVYVTGASRDTINGTVLTIKYDMFGNQVWERRYFGDIFSGGMFIYISQDDFIYVAGVESMPGQSDFLCIKYDSLGNQQWVSVYNPEEPTQGWSRVNDVKFDSEGNVYFTGVKSWGYAEHDDYCTVKVGNDGNLIWARTYNGGFGWDHATSLAIDEFNNVYITGESDDIVFGGHQIITTIKYTESGDIDFIVKYLPALQNSYYVPFIGLDSLSNIYVSATCGSNSPHFVTLKYSRTTGVEEVDSNGELKIYPNPLSNILTIETTINDIVGYSIYDLSGRLLQSGSFVQSKSIDVSGLAEGVYLIRVEIDKGIANKKFIKQ